MSFEVAFTYPNEGHRESDVHKKLKEMGVWETPGSLENPNGPPGHDWFQLSAEDADFIIKSCLKVLNEKDGKNIIQEKVSNTSTSLPTGNDAEPKLISSAGSTGGASLSSAEPTSSSSSSPSSKRQLV